MAAGDWVGEPSVIGSGEDIFESIWLEVGLES